MANPFGNMQVSECSTGDSLSDVRALTKREITHACRLVFVPPGFVVFGVCLNPPPNLRCSFIFRVHVYQLYVVVVLLWLFVHILICFIDKDLMGLTGLY